MMCLELHPFLNIGDYLKHSNVIWYSISHILIKKQFSRSLLSVRGNITVFVID
jgi:hypothetical protein